MIVAVDGPAGSGKSSICSQVCEDLGWSYINTGFFYRAFAYFVQQHGIDVADEPAIGAALEQLHKLIRWDDQSGKIFLGQEDITEYLIQPEISIIASKLAKLPLVREELLPLQRSLIDDITGGVIVDGRDIGTVVFPNAPLKVFMTASLQVRAERRCLQLEEKGKPRDFDEVKSEIAARDAQDQNRAAAPLTQAPDAVLLDTSELSKEQAVAKLTQLIQEKLD